MKKKLKPLKPGNYKASIKNVQVRGEKVELTVKIGKRILKIS